MEELTVLFDNGFEREVAHFLASRKWMRNTAASQDGVRRDTYPGQSRGALLEAIVLNPDSN